MPNARTHDFITLVTGAALAPAALSMNLPDINPPNALVLMGSYLVSGLLFSPDLDIRSSPYKRWRGMRWVWLPYQRSVRHRSWVSHSFVFGPLLRVLYFAGVLIILSLLALFALNLLVPVDPTGTLLTWVRGISRWMQTHPVTIAYTTLGFIGGGAAHTLADVVFTAVKRRL